MLTLATDVKFLLISLSVKSILNHFIYFIHFSLSHFFGNFLSRSILYVQCVVCPLSAQNQPMSIAVFLKGEATYYHIPSDNPQIPIRFVSWYEVSLPASILTFN